ncbi:MAG: hypothetical protein OHK0029_06930 [Armatimonadaceae bacterium]
MNAQERKAMQEKLEARGWKTTTVEEFLGLTPEESALIEMRLNLRNMLKASRGAAQLSQVALAERIHSSQSRIAKAEAGDPSISLELLCRAILATGASRTELGKCIAADPAALAGLSDPKGHADLDDAIEEILSDV